MSTHDAKFFKCIPVLLICMFLIGAKKAIFLIRQRQVANSGKIYLD